MRLLSTAVFLVAVGISDRHINADENRPEVHLVTVSEGFEQTGETIHGPRVLVHVDRPDKQVILVLICESGATWHITTSKKTAIAEVILGGGYQQAVKGLPETVKLTKVWAGVSEIPLRGAHKTDGVNFRRLVKRAFALTGHPLASCHGDYRATADAPLRIDKVQDDPILAVDYPPITTRAELPEDARDLEFESFRFWRGESRYDSRKEWGRFTPSGPIEDSFKPFPKGVNRLTYCPDTKSYFGILLHEISQFSSDFEDVQELDMGLDVPRLSWPFEITYDTKRRRVLLGSSGGGGYWYAYSIEKQEWSVISKRTEPVEVFTYSPQDDCLFGIRFSHAGDGATLVRVSPETLRVVDFCPLEPTIERGTLLGGPGTPLTRLAIAGKYIAILASPDEHREHHAENDDIYLVDFAKRKVWLTARSKIARPD